jgi:glutathione S-transferase
MMKLIIANKNYSSWSLRPWLLLRQAGIPFTEEKLSFNAPDFAAQVQRTSPAGLVPVLIDDDVVVWDSLAIVEHLAERFPEKKLWPVDRAARGLARSICAEMHAGFPHLRHSMTTNLTARLPGLGWNLKVQDEIDRIVAIWDDARRRFGAGGPFLFGAFSIADAYFAPVTRRFVTYGVKVPEVAQAYGETIAAVPAMQEWLAAAAAENEFDPRGEPYRRPPSARAGETP